MVGVAYQSGALMVVSGCCGLLLKWKLPGGGAPRERTGGTRHRTDEGRACLQAIAADPRRYHEDLRRKFGTGSSGARGGFHPERIVLRYLDRYGDGLSGHPVACDAAWVTPIWDAIRRTTRPKSL